jgi:hypothetical protein
MRHLLTTAFLLGILSIGNLAHTADGGTTELYAVIFGVVVDEKHQLASLRVTKVIDPRSGLLMRTLNSAYPSIDGFLLPPGKGRMRVVLARFPLTPVLSWIERGQTIRII